MKIQPEQAEQIRVADWMRIMHPDIPFMHIANERKCSYQYGELLKRMGCRAGIADLFFPAPTSDRKYNGLWIELKYGKNRLTPHQKRFLEDMRKIGYKAECCYGADDAMIMIKWFYSLK